MKNFDSENVQYIHVNVCYGNTSIIDGRCVSCTGFSSLNWLNGFYISGIKATGWSKGCLNGTTCSINNECRTTHTGVIKHITCASCCQGDLCNTGSPPASASSLGAFSPLVMSTLTVVAFLFMN